MSAMEVEGIRPISSVSPRGDNSDAEQDTAPRKKSRKSTIMEALLRGASQPQGQAGNSQQMSTVATASPRFAPQPYRHVPRRTSSPLPRTPLTPKSSLSPAGLPSYTHTEKLDLAGLPPVPTSSIYYFRQDHNTPNAVDDVNWAIEQMLGRMNPPPDSRWRGVVGFDMEWTVSNRGPKSTGLIQISDETSILLIQISSMKEFPSKLKYLITSSTIIKVGVNIAGDITKLVKDFGTEYAGRAVLELSVLARLADVGLVGTKVDDLDTNQASVGIGIKRADTQTETTSDAPDDENFESNGEDEVVAAEKKTTTGGRKDKAKVDKRVKDGRALVQLARLSRRYFGRELEKGEERMSNWDQLLTSKQRGYAANDAHACLALYHALRTVHTRSIAEGVIPVGNPPPWEDKGTTQITPAPPPFRAKTTTSDEANPHILPINTLQNLTPGQLESLIPWSTIILDSQAEMADKRAAVREARAQAGVDVNGKGEAVIAAEAEAAARKFSKDTAKPRTTSTSKTATTPKTHVVKPVTAAKPGATMTSDTPVTIDNEVQARTPDEETPGDTSVGPLVDDIIQEPSKGRARVLERRRAVEEKRNEVMGKRWPPVRTAASTADSSFSTAPIGQSGGLSPLVSHSLLSSDAPPLPSTLKRPAVPARHASSPASIPQKAPSSEQLRAYLLWHNRLFTVAQICTTMGTAKRPLIKHTVISHIMESLQLDEALPFDAPRLRALVDSDTTDWTREHYRVFLEQKLGDVDGKSQ
ncbi:hypothetical protein BDV93DRAFT_522096 [Ceratobasidium sp. AG-I]|nr:hypothetical protein BDV93DRAFT_522096 [Ceratobasidium sp. AG-I]